MGRVNIHLISAHLEIHAGHVGDKMDPVVHMRLGHDGQEWTSPVAVDGGHKPEWGHDAHCEWHFPVAHHTMHFKVRNANAHQDHHLGHAEVNFVELHEHEHGHHEKEVRLTKDGADVGHIKFKYHVL